MAKQKTVVKKKKKGMKDGKPKFELLIAKPEILAKKITQVMKKHIGRESAILAEDLFEKVYGVNHLDVEFFKRQFLYERIRLMISFLRRSNKIYVINKTTYLFVLKTEEECSAYKAFLDRDIAGLQKSKKRAQKWVDEELWRKL